jgi:hypothetical protein
MSQPDSAYLPPGATIGTDLSPDAPLQGRAVPSASGGAPWFAVS